MVRHHKSADTIVFWDKEDCPIPDGLNTDAINDNIEMALMDKGYDGDVLYIAAYGDMEDLMNGFGGFAINHYPDRVARRTAMLVDFLNCAIGMDGEKLNLMLILGDISGDVGFLGAIRAMKLHRKCNVLLSQPQLASGDKIYGVRTKWLWNKLATGEDLSHQYENPGW